MTYDQEDLPTDPEIIDKYLWVLNCIKKEEQLTLKGEAISYPEYNARKMGKGILTAQEEDSILRRLEQWEIIEITKKTIEIYHQLVPGACITVRAVNILNLEKFKEIKEGLEKRRTEERRVNKAVVGRLEEMTERQEEKEGWKKEAIEEFRKEQQSVKELGELPQKKKKQKKENILYLNKVGDLYREPKEKYSYSMGESEGRHKIIRYFVENKIYRYHPTRELAMELGRDNTSFMKEVGKINNIIQGKLKIKDKIIEGRQGSGYRLNPKYKIILKDE